MNVVQNKTVAEYRRYLIGLEKSRATVEKYVRDVGAFFEWLAGEMLTREAVLAYKQHISERYAVASVNSMLSSINGYFDFCGLPQLKVRHLRIQRKMFAGENKELTKAEYERLISTAKSTGKERLCMIMQTLCCLGLRVSELEYITVAAVKQGCAHIACKGKLRTVVMPREICKMLGKYIRKNKISSGSVFVTKSGKPVDRSNIWSAMKELCKAAGVSAEKVFPHNLRHPYVKLKLKIFFNLFYRRIHTEVLNFPYYLNSFIGINKHFINEHIG